MKPQKIFIYLICSILVLFTGCKTEQTVFLSDRHGLSYEIIKNKTIDTNIKTLILFDFHNDVNTDIQITRSYNWIGKLIQENYLTKVYWICDTKLDSVEKQQKNEWLQYNASKLNDDTQNKIKTAFQIMDFSELTQTTLSEKFFITFDLDLVTLSKKEPSDQFLNKICQWILSHNSSLVTVSLSAVYQENAKLAWDCLYQFVTNYNVNANWYFESGEFEEKPESNEDIAAWQFWENNESLFLQNNTGFYKGTYLWMNAPANIQIKLLSRKIKPYNGHKATTEVIKYWNENTD